MRSKSVISGCISAFQLFRDIFCRITLHAENIDKNVRNKFNSHLFEVNYVECSVALSESQVLTNATVINALKYALGFHVRGACLYSFELESLNTGLEDVDLDRDEDDGVDGEEEGADGFGADEDDNDGDDDEVY